MQRLLLLKCKVDYEEKPTIFFSRLGMEFAKVPS